MGGGGAGAGARAGTAVCTATGEATAKGAAAALSGKRARHSWSHQGSTAASSPVRSSASPLRQWVRRGSASARERERLGINASTHQIHTARPSGELGREVGKAITPWDKACGAEEREAAVERSRGLVAVLGASALAVQQQVRVSEAL